MSDLETLYAQLTVSCLDKLFDELYNIAIQMDDELESVQNQLEMSLVYNEMIEEDNKDLRKTICDLEKTISDYKEKFLTMDRENTKLYEENYSLRNCATNAVNVLRSAGLIQEG